MTVWHEINYTAPASMHVHMHIQTALQLQFCMPLVRTDCFWAQDWTQNLPNMK